MIAFLTALTLVFPHAPAAGQVWHGHKSWQHAVVDQVWHGHKTVWHPVAPRPARVRGATWRTVTPTR